MISILPETKENILIETINLLDIEKEDLYQKCNLAHEAVQQITETGQIKFKQECPDNIKTSRVGCPHGYFLHKLTIYIHILSLKHKGDSSLFSFERQSLNDLENDIKKLDREERNINIAITRFEKKMEITNGIYSDIESAILASRKTKETHQKKIDEIFEIMAKITPQLCQMLLEESKNHPYQTITPAEQ